MEGFIINFTGSPEYFCIKSQNNDNALCFVLFFGQKEMTQRTVTACPQPRGRPNRGTANLTHTTASAWKLITAKPFTMCRPITGG